MSEIIENFDFMEIGQAIQNVRQDQHLHGQNNSSMFFLQTETVTCLSCLNSVFSVLIMVYLLVLS